MVLKRLIILVFYLYKNSNILHFFFAKDIFYNKNSLDLLITGKLCKLLNQGMTIKAFLDHYNAEGSHKISGELYTQCRDGCVKWLLKQSSIQDVNAAKDIFTDALLILLDNAEKGKIDPSSTQVQTYLMTICRNTQSNAHKRKDRASEWEFDTLIEQIAEENTEGGLEKEALLVRIETTLAQVNEPCASLFRLYYYEGYAHKEIAKIQGYASESVSKSMLYKCKVGFGKLFGALKGEHRLD
jgi:RNA polymerase sigma factor (sigma-70 family)